MSTPLRVGIMGVGGLGSNHGRRVNETTHATVTAIADISEANLQSAGKALDVEPGSRYEDYEVMLAEESLDAVIIATPHTLHYEQCVAALERGLHVLCEKPLATDLERARDLHERSQAGDELLMVGYQRHIEGPYVKAREVIEGFAGHPKFITASITQNWIDSQQGTWRVNPDLSGGGQLYDTGSHIIDVVLWATDLTPTAVTGSMVFADDENRVDSQATLTVEFAEPAVATIAVSGDSPEVREHHRFWTDDGAVYIDGRGWNAREVRVIDPDGAERYPRVQDAFTNKIVSFFEAIEQDKTPPATTKDALEVTAVTEAAYEAARTGSRVDIDL